MKNDISIKAFGIIGIIDTNGTKLNTNSAINATCATCQSTNLRK